MERISSEFLDIPDVDFTMDGRVGFFLTAELVCGRVPRFLHLI